MQISCVALHGDERGREERIDKEAGKGEGKRSDYVNSMNALQVQKWVVFAI